MLSPHKYFPHITQIFSMLLDSHKYSLYKPHKLPWALSQILLIISYILSNLDFPQKYLSHYYQIGPQNYTISAKKPKIIYLTGKIQKAQQNPFKNPLLHGTSKTRYYTAPLKSPFLHSTSKILLLHSTS